MAYLSIPHVVSLRLGEEGDGSRQTVPDPERGPGTALSPFTYHLTHSSDGVLHGVPGSPTLPGVCRVKTILRTVIKHPAFLTVRTVDGAKAMGVRKPPRGSAGGTALTLNWASHHSQ